MRENPAISDWVPISGGSTEGLLGGWLAQRQAALREVMAAGALPTFTLGHPCVPVISRAASVPQEENFWKPLSIGNRPSRSALNCKILIPKRGRAQSFLTGLGFRKEALKGCSAGGWRSGRRR